VQPFAGVLRTRPRTRPQTDAAHAPEAFLQWWYFDALLESGHRFLAFFLPRFAGSIEGGEPGLPMMEVALRSPDGQTCRARRFFQPGEFRAPPDRFHATFGEDGAVTFHPGGGRRGLGRYTLRGRAGDMGFDLSIEPEVPAWSPSGPGGFFPRPFIMLLRRSLSSREWFHYVPFVPRGRMAGTITAGGETLDARGTAYHEQGRLNFCLSQFVPVWYWLHIERAPWTLLSGTGVPPRWLPRPGSGARGGIAFVQKGDACRMAAMDVTGLFVRWPRVRTRGASARDGRGMAWEASACLRRPGLRVDIEMVSRDVLVLVPFRYAEPTPVPPCWGQTVADARVEIRAGRRRTRFECQGLLETMVTGAL